MAVTAFALSASTAVAQILVENTGHHAVESENTLAIGPSVPGVGFITSWRCENRWEVDVAEDGTLNLFGEHIESHPGSVGDCEIAEPCNAHAAWPGSFSEVAGHEEVHFTFCLEGTNVHTSRRQYSLECDVENHGTHESFHCDDVVGNIGASEGGFAIEVEGEIATHESLGLMHG
jgi:hypothetical protein